MVTATRRRVGVGAAWSLVALAAVFIALVPPEGQTFWPKCLLNFATGLHCPGCGGTRSLHLLAQGDILGALHQNALFVLIEFPLGIWLFAKGMKFVVTGKYNPPRIASRAINLALVVAVLAFLILRNIPIEPFTHLAPQPLHADAQR